MGIELRADPDSGIRIDLRDWLAVQFALACIARGEVSVMVVTDDAYLYADAMLKSRDKPTWTSELDHDDDEGWVHTGDEGE